jgi:DNA-binding NtrC family response regulator
MAGMAEPQRDPAVVQRFWLLVVDGPDSGATFTSAGERTVIGTYDAADLVLHDSTVSRFHCEIVSGPGRLVLRDLGSLNGTRVNGVAIGAAILASGATVSVGRTQIRFDAASEPLRLPVSERTSFGLLAGRSTAMRRAFALLERAAATDTTVLLEGEVGSGKEAAAESIHRESARRDGPFIAVDCGAASAAQLESELFGREDPGARAGAFEAAHGGTLFLDEIGELPLELQPKLLRVLERREVRRVTGGRPAPVDVRVVAASSRNLRTEVNAKRFRSDLYYRLAVVAVRMPPLRERTGDLPLLVEAFGGGPVAGLADGPWPGNVRELRERIERRRALAEAPGAPGAGAEPAIDPSEPLEAGREAWVRAHERNHLAALLQRHGGDVLRAARAAAVDRLTFHRLLARHGLR